MSEALGARLAGDDPAVEALDRAAAGPLEQLRKHRVDEAGSSVNVIDYKTGKPKSRNELLGKTKDADGNYYRQLTFYKLLLKCTDEARTMHEGIIEFVEPDDKGRIRTEAFEISDSEVDELEQLIRDTAQYITTLSFWNEPCDEAECEWCALRFSL